MKALIGVMPEEMVRQRMLAILKGDYKPAADEPKIWYNLTGRTGADPQPGQYCIAQPDV